MEEPCISPELIERCKKQDEQAYCVLVDMYAKRCFGYFYRMTGKREISNDLLSELFMKLVTKIGSFKGGSFEQWLFTIASNVFYDHLRKQKRDAKLIEAQQKQIAGEEYHKPKDDDRSDELAAHLSKLDEPTRELITLRFYSDMSFKEIAQSRGEPIGTVLSKVHRGLAKLRQYMEQKI
ncbi:MAG: hypothetical protein A2Y07_00670 [Planctomycetes bacterium GWF2_50_10]|nr:MAG: hypothetical protein A2Y07_00670 [Planctomycetes bacterium GWF2_50_10]